LHWTLRFAANRRSTDYSRFSNLAGLGKAHLEPLLKIRIDPAQLDKADSMSDELADLLASAQVEREGGNGSVTIRDQAYTHLKEAVDEIRASGQYVFWRNEERFQGYISQYHKNSTAKRKVRRMIRPLP
jgi:hypothetical protein